MSPPADPSAVPELERVPWSVLGPEFARIWGRPGGRQEPEHLEVVGPTGSGKSYFLATILQERVRLRDSHVVYIATKPVDRTILALGWPIVTDWNGVRKHPQCIFWPRTKKLGEEAERFHERAIRGLLDRMWTAESNRIVAFDEIGYVEDLSSDMRKVVRKYWREGRALGITVIAGKQRPQGVQRDMHSESSWAIAFRPKDDDDAERVAQLFGAKRTWMPVLQSLDRGRREFLIKHSVTDVAYISWVDQPLKPAQRRSALPFQRKTA